NRVIINENTTKDEILENHYREMVGNHNKNQRGKDNYWNGVKGYLKTWEGKYVGKTKNQRWATESEISYLGNQETMNKLFDRFKDVGLSERELQDAYTRGYGNYVKRHNEEFPTLQITRSDIHFDESTPHGHDEIVPTGHTEKGRPSSTINNAISEWAGSYGIVKADKANGVKREDNRSRMRLYRDVNDSIMFDEMNKEF